MLYDCIDGRARRGSKSLVGFIDPVNNNPLDRLSQIGVVDFFDVGGPAPANPVLTVPLPQLHTEPTRDTERQTTPSNQRLQPPPLATGLCTRRLHQYAEKQQPQRDDSNFTGQRADKRERSLALLIPVATVLALRTSPTIHLEVQQAQYDENPRMIVVSEVQRHRRVLYTCVGSIVRTTPRTRVISKIR